MRPLIGISLCLDDRGRWKCDRDYHYIDAAYARAIEAAGGSPVYIPIQEADSPRNLELDGLLVAGGDDFPPPPDYPPGVDFNEVPALQLAFDRRLLMRALERDLPILAICYGMQLLAICRGGSLYYDIPTDIPSAAEHQLPESDGCHGIAVEPETRLAVAIGTHPPPVNSLHHQAVDQPGARMRVSARSDDGLVESIECEGSRFCIGVQWHPEKMSGIHRDGLLGAFIAACVEGRNRFDPSDETVRASVRTTSRDGRMRR